MIHCYCGSCILSVYESLQSLYLNAYHVDSLGYRQYMTRVRNQSCKCGQYTTLRVISTSHICISTHICYAISDSHAVSWLLVGSLTEREVE